MTNLWRLARIVPETWRRARRDLKLFALMDTYGITGITPDLYEQLTEAFIVRHGHHFEQNHADWEALIEKDIYRAARKYDPIALYTLLLTARNVWLFSREDSLAQSATFQLERGPAEPPHLVEFLVGVFAKKRYRESLLQCLDEDFQKDINNGMSLRRAKWRYRAAAARTIFPQVCAAIKRVGVIGMLADYVRGKLGGA